NRAETEKQIKEYLVDNLHAKGALFMIDTDNFKQINDTEGHMVGDVVLAELANGMKRLMRESDIVGRIG
ncbi:diguanylate cyclase domain-containing protein, partial [Thomasclavelia ramosa]